MHATPQLCSTDFWKQGGECTSIDSQKVSVLFNAVIHLDDLRTSQKLDNQAGGDNRSDTELHHSPSVGSKDDSHPVERVRTGRRVDSIQRQLTADEEDEEGRDSVEQPDLKALSRFGVLDFGKKAKKWTD